MSDMCLNLENESGYACVGACENADGCNRIKEMDDLRKDSITDAVSIYGYVSKKRKHTPKQCVLPFNFAGLQAVALRDIYYALAALLSIRGRLFHLLSDLRISIVGIQTTKRLVNGFIGRKGFGRREVEKTV